MADQYALRRWLDTLNDYGLEISGFTAHGEPLSPNKEVADEDYRFFLKASRLAEATGTRRLVLSGIPASAPGDTCPSWVVDSFCLCSHCTLRWQRQERLIPFLREHGKIAEDHGCLICVEPQIGELVHSPPSLMRLRETIGSSHCNSLSLRERRCP